ncbi:hypothetical protein [Halorhodospira halochloris]|uniref:hypothetical protein n=1 Tax=Halorhodospira halochloris TaxID=1052 RepID=UPI001EE93249|nr:hypothetical protein [Halorhodospira halochloris]MCG5549432.1 hypothetical protein [Halorhodospira halochloris]
MGHEIRVVVVAEADGTAEGHAVQRDNGYRASAVSDRRGRRAHHVCTDDVGTWEAHRVLGTDAEGRIPRDDRRHAVCAVGWLIGV